MDETRREALTPTGIARRDAMLIELVQVAQRRHRTRRIRRRFVTGAVVLAVAILSVRFGSPTALETRRSPQMATSSPYRTGRTNAVGADRARRCIVQRVPTRVGTVERLRAQPTERIVRMDDALLLETLASVYRPSGLIRVGEGVRLSTPVTDAQLGFTAYRIANYE